MSSYLSKSKKDFKPKFAPRRPGASAAINLVPAAVRSSVERQPSQLQRDTSIEVHQASSPLSTVQRRADSLQDLSVIQQDAGSHSDVQHGHLHGKTNAQPSSTILHNNGEFDIPEDDASLRSLHQLRPAHRTSEAALNQPSTRQLPSPPPTHPSTRSNRQQLQHTTSHENDTGSSRKRRKEAATIERFSRETVEATSDTDANTAHDSQIQASVIQVAAGDDSEISSQRQRQSKRVRIERLAEQLVDEALEGDESNSGSVLRQATSRKRVPTPEDAEQSEITPTRVTMSELTKDTRLGKKSTREKRLQDREREIAAKRKEEAQAQARQQAEEFMEHPEGSLPNGSSSTGSAVNSTAPAPALPPAPRTLLAPRVRVVNGQIVQDEDSRVLDRHQQPLSNVSDEAIVEDELTRHVNSGSYMRRERHTKWTAEENERFYQGLRWFGTDFQTIAHMFPGRTRRQIKLKFNKEERDPEHSNDIRRALFEERQTADLDVFESYAQLELRELQAHKDDLEKDHNELVAAQARETAAQAEQQRERELAAEAEAAAHARSRQQQEALRPAATVTEDEAVDSTAPETNHDIVAGKAKRRRVTTESKQTKVTSRARAQAKANDKDIYADKRPVRTTPSGGKERSTRARLQASEPQATSNEVSGNNAADPAATVVTTTATLDVLDEPVNSKSPTSTKRGRGRPRNTRTDVASPAVATKASDNQTPAQGKSSARAPRQAFSRRRSVATATAQQQPPRPAASPAPEDTITINAAAHAANASISAHGPDDTAEPGGVTPAANPTPRRRGRPPKRSATGAIGDADEAQQHFDALGALPAAAAGKAGKPPLAARGGGIRKQRQQGKAAAPLGQLTSTAEAAEALLRAAG